MTEIKWTIPGTVLVAPREEAQFIENQFSAMFLGGGVALSQITAVTGLLLHLCPPNDQVLPSYQHV